MLDLGKYSEPDFNATIPEKTHLDINGTLYDLSRQEIGKWIKESTTLSYNPNYRSEIENINFCAVKKSIVCDLAFSEKNFNHIQKNSTILADRDLIEKFAKDLARKSNKDPENAKLKMESGKVSVFSLSYSGINLDEKKSVEILLAYLQSSAKADTLELPFSEIKPEVSIDSIDNMGITHLIGEGHSNFSGSPKNRIYNIRVATNRFNGILIKPGEEFSFVKVLGEVDEDHGYLPELVIKKNKTEMEFGGGICQVSTTAFRAAINSGLEITARTNHAYPVAYYNPQGMDATVYVPRPDLKFINDTPGYILIQTEIKGTELIFYFYGTNDGRKVTIIGPKILEKNPDGSLKTTFTQQIFSGDNQLVREDVFNSNYDSPSKYPHPDTTVYTQKPNGWSEKQWNNYKKLLNL